VAIAGGRTQWSLGGPVADGARVVVAPSGVLDHQPDEMIVRVRGGTPVAELHAVLATAHQRTALPERGGTVGGAIAVGQNDVRVLGRGHVRHAVLQVTYVSSEGSLVTGGAPTVKNVSGFDLPRLLVGSLGTLGFIVEVILRTNPLPSAARWLVADDTDAFAVHAALYRPSTILWDGSRTWVELEGHPTDVDAEEAVLRSLGSWQRTEAGPELPAHRWSLRPSDLRDIDPASTGEFVASVGVGTVFAARRQDRPPASPGVRQLSERIKREFDPTGRLNPGRDPLQAA
jgi:glycolate oxidase FAD binding subunit